MMKVLIIAMVMIFATSISHAQPGQRVGPGIDPGVHSLFFQDFNELNLSANQKKEIAGLMVEHRSDIVRNFGQQRPGRRGRASARSNRKDNSPISVERRQEIRADYHNGMMEILTDEQVEMLQEKAVKRAETFHEIRMLQHEIALDKAGVSEEKKEQVLTLLREHGDKMLNARKQAIVDMELEPGARIWSGNVEERRELQNRLEEILTEEERYQLWQTMGIWRGEPRNGNRFRNR